ncbi:MAG: hypothetical protein IJY27_01625 [Clostridia bacterium]|nr:hypothetical protein [Clostridia bacterium]
MSHNKHRSLFAIYTLIFAIGAVGYYLLELLWRGRSHISMALCGGVCLCSVCAANTALSHKPIYVRSAVGALIITAIEFVFGCVLNLAWGLGVWDYSSQPLNLAGQICPLYSLLWYMLCIPICALHRLILRLRQPAKVNILP